MIIGYVLIGILVALVVYLIVYKRKISKTNKKYADTNSGGDSVKKTFTKDAIGDIFKIFFVLIAAVLGAIGLILLISGIMNNEPLITGITLIGVGVAFLFVSWLIGTLSSINVNLKEINEKLSNNRTE